MLLKVGRANSHAITKQPTKYLHDFLYWGVNDIPSKSLSEKSLAERAFQRTFLHLALHSYWYLQQHMFQETNSSD